MTAAIRAKAVCLFRHNGKVLLAEGYDPAKDQHYLIPVGGGIEFGETSREAAEREVKEEIGADVTSLELLGVSENLFTFDGRSGHEIVFVYQGRFVDQGYYQKTHIDGIETNGVEFVVKWVEESELLAGKIPIYPEGISEMLPT
ncbi:NUDIX domain-containing protein [Vibrio mediterranei]|uniref:NUDIX hydrolase n=1 Tax=Vibrio mediterranei TaxID=689 RepID=UPI0004E1E0A9|nr:NUDIX hydrolase [Vibrio mediterranei]MCG9662533.1 NUDIX hydrolase [Vibrio mediterranei]NUW74952.1 NUDIX hydrolase [Vibrio mediterranei]PTC02201.1 NUDIX domain-containing protein [Vibrio mediterranei]